MKKLLLSAFCVLVSLTAGAQGLVFSGNLSVTVDGKGGSMPAEVYLTPGSDEDHANLAINNFCLKDGENNMYIGNIVIEDISYSEKAVEGQPGETVLALNASRNITITPGTEPSDAIWLGPMLGEIPVELTGTFNPYDMSLNVDIDINFVALGQIIKVEFESEDFKMCFTDNLKVTVNGQSASQQTTVFIANAGYDDATDSPIIDFSLPNLKLAQGTDAMYVGTIHVDGIKLNEVDEEGRYYTFTYKGDLLIEEGNLEGVDTWLGTLLGPVPLDLKGEFDSEAGVLHFVIDIDMQSSLGQIINVEFGTPFLTSIQQAVQKALSASLTYGIDGKVAQKGIVIQNGKKVLK